MKIKQNKIMIIMISVSAFVFFLSLISLIFGDELEEMFNVIGIRIAVLIVAFASFCSSTLFSLLILVHNRTVVKINDDTNKRAELFRELQFASSNYSIIEFMDRMLIYDESSRYVDKFVKRKLLDFHMLDSSIKEEDVYENPDAFTYLSVKIPFRVIEGKMTANITIRKLKFERDDLNFIFVTPPSLKETTTYLLYNEHTKRNNIIVNIIVPKDSVFFDKKKLNVFSKIKIDITITSLLGVNVKGVSELFFTNPEQIEGDGTSTYRINSSNFLLVAPPTIKNLFEEDE